MIGSRRWGRRHRGCRLREQRQSPLGHRRWPQGSRDPRRRRKKEEDEDDDFDGGYSKTNDPVRMYLRKMGSVSLLTREGEVEIAKRIEEGERRVLQVVLNSAIAVEEILELGEKLKKAKIRVKDVVRDLDDGTPTSTRNGTPTAS